MSKLRNVVVFAILAAAGAVYALTFNWQVPADPPEGGAYWGTTSNWDLGSLPGSSDVAKIINPTGKYYCIYDPENDPGITDSTTVVDRIQVGIDNTGEAVSGEVVVNSGILYPLRVYIGHPDYVNRVGRVTVNNGANLRSKYDFYIGPSPTGDPSKERSGGILILNDDATANDRFAYNYMTRVGGFPGEFTSNQSLMQLNDSSMFSATRLEVSESGTVDVRDNSLLRIKGGNQSETDINQQFLNMQSYVDAGRLIADGGASKISIVQGDNVEVTASPRQGGADITAWDFDPADNGMLTTSGDATLRWIRGYHPSNDPNISGVDNLVIDQHVYVSSDESLVVNRDSSSLVTTLTKEQSLDITGLDIGETYYWTVDCEYSDNTVGLGAVNSFFTVNPVDSFESYEDTAELQSVWGSNATLAAEGYDSGQSMSVSYSGSDVNVSASGNWNLLQGGNEQALILKFKGAQDNDNVNMSITLTDNAGNAVKVYYGGDKPDMPAAVRSIGWESWNIELDDFVGLDLTNIVQFDIDIETDIPTTYGGTADGTILFDHIMSSPPFYLGSPYLGDVNGDGVVNTADLKSFLSGFEGWLFNGNVTDSSATAMVKLLEEEGNENVEVSPNYVTGRLAGSQAVRMDGSQGEWVDINDFVVGNFRNSTIAFWVKFNSIDPATQSFIIGTSSDWRLYIGLFDGKLRIQGPSVFVDGLSVNEDQWYHISLTTEDTADGLSTSKAYLDGNLLDFDAGRERHVGSYLGAVAVGTRNEGWGMGDSDITVSDLRFYDVTLTDSQISDIENDTVITPSPSVQYTFDGTLTNSGTRTSVSAPYLDNALDINLDGVINYGDFAVVADMWLDDVKFPYNN